jgi:hypothetical protein
MFRIRCFDANGTDLGWVAADTLNYSLCSMTDAVGLDWYDDPRQNGKRYLKAFAGHGVTVDRYLGLGDPVGSGAVWTGWCLWGSDAFNQKMPVTGWDPNTGILTVWFNGDGGTRVGYNPAGSRGNFWSVNGPGWNNSQPMKLVIHEGWE